MGEVRLDFYRHYRDGKLTNIVAHFDPGQFYNLGAALEQVYGAPATIDVDLSGAGRSGSIPHASHRWDFSNATVTVHAGERRGRAVGLLSIRSVRRATSEGR